MTALPEIAPNCWYEIPSSRIDQSAPLPKPSLFSGITAYSGACYDSQRDRIYLHGGGHTDYGGNEIYAFDLASLAWSRLYAPSNPAGIDTEAAPDGKPTSRHTYDSLVYDPVNDLMFLQGGSLWYQGIGSGGAWTFNPATLAWTNIATGKSGSYEVNGVFDAISGHVFFHGHTVLYEINLGDSSYVTRLSGDDMNTNFGLACALDSVRRRLIITLDHSATLATYDLTAETITRQSQVTTGETGVLTSDGSPGIEYDSVNDRFIAWKGAEPGGVVTDVYLLNPTTWVWTKQTAGNAVSVPAYQTPGVYGRWCYSPKYHLCFLIPNDVTKNVFAYNPGSTTFFPPRKWIKRAAPAGGPTTGQYSITPGGGKHGRLAYCTSNKKVYALGGDWETPVGTNVVHTYDIGTGIWSLITPSTVPAGEVQPDLPDLTMFAYNSDDGLLWLIPGQQGGPTGDGKHLYGRIMTLNPSTGKWTDVTASPVGIITGEYGYSAYDPYNGIVWFGIGTTDGAVKGYNVTTGEIKTSSSVASNVTANPGVRTQPCLDTLRKCFWLAFPGDIDYSQIQGPVPDLDYRGRLYRMDLDPLNLTLSYIGLLPCGNRWGLSEEEAVVPYDAAATMFYDAAHDKILYPFISNQLAIAPPMSLGQVRLFIGTPNVDGTVVTWEEDVNVSGSGYALRFSLDVNGGIVTGNAAVFDPYQNVLMLHGTSSSSLRRPYIFFYRYGPPTAAEEDAPPAAPLNLRIV